MYGLLFIYAIYFKFENLTIYSLEADDFYVEQGWSCQGFLPDPLPLHLPGIIPPPLHLIPPLEMVIKCVCQG